MSTCRLTCKCGASTTGVVLEDDPETNSFQAEPKYPDEWEGGSADCKHEDFTADDVEHEDPFLE